MVQRLLSRGNHHTLHRDPQLGLGRRYVPFSLCDELYNEVLLQDLGSTLVTFYGCIQIRRFSTVQKLLFIGAGETFAFILFLYQVRHCLCNRALDITLAIAAMYSSRGSTLMSHFPEFGVCARYSILRRHLVASTVRTFSSGSILRPASRAAHRRGARWVSAFWR